MNARFLFFLFLAGLVSSKEYTAAGAGFTFLPDSNPLVVVPKQVNGVRQCRLDLNGIWHFTTTPGSEFWKDTSSTGWRTIHVPGEPMMQGFVLKHDVEYAYRKPIRIPRDFAGKRTILRFNGVYSHARVWIDGHFVREHDGGFTSWDCDITSFVRDRRTVTISLGVTDRLDDISYGSGYAHHPIGGILRDVELFALPEDHIRTLYTTVHFDSLYRDATLAIQSSLNRPTEALLSLALYDPSGRQIELSSSKIRFSEKLFTASLSIPIAAPLHWDAEHPRLYTLKARLVQNGTATEVISQRIGFREVRVQGNKLFVNGMPIKLRGACRHDIHPTQGRSTTPAQDKQDVLLAKEANFNFIRTSHYPPSREFLENCDEYGLYVEEETAICFVGTHRNEPYQAKGASQNDSAYASRYLSQLSEMIDRDRNHPSVIIWSIGNENEYGANFQAEYEFVKRDDRSRPVMFSYPGKVPRDSTCYDIISMHYVAYDGSANQLGIEVKNFGLPSIPVLHDEWAHVACYDTSTLKTDLNIRNFWGESLKKMWDACFDSDGGLGGAIWGYIDECFMLPDTVVGYGPWGIIDTWRRKKPEFWLTKKAYSPVRVQQTRFESCDHHKDLIVPLYNRFDHTNTKELRIQVTSVGTKHMIAAPDIPPHTKGTLRLPPNVLVGKEVKLTFFDQRNLVVDEELLTFATEKRPSALRPKRIRVSESPTSIGATGDGFTLTFNKQSGLLENGLVDGTRVILSGPYLHLVGSGGPISWIADSVLDLTGAQWQLGELNFQQSQEDLRVFVHGRSGTIDVHFEIVVSGNGEIQTSFEIPTLPEKFREVGIRYLLDKGLDSLSWKREGLWSLYPDDHIGRSIGTASKFALAAQREDYRVKPTQSWSLDTKDFYLYGKEGRQTGHTFPVPVDFRTTKENILHFTLTDARLQYGIRVTSEATVAARAVVNADGTTTLVVMNEWNYSDLRWGNYERVKELPPHFRGEIHMQFVH